MSAEGGLRVRYFIVQDHRENRRKCTAEPLRGLPGLELVRLRAPAAGDERLRLPPGIVLEIGAPPLARRDVELLAPGGKLVILDASWARIRLMKGQLAAPGARLAPRSLPPGLRSAYPRASKLYEDPAAGLATVEAMFAASVVLGEPRPEFFERYRWAARFLDENGELLRSFESASAATDAACGNGSR